MLIDNNMVVMMICELNKEINFKLSENEACLYNEDGGDYLQVVNDGNDLKIYFLGSLLFSSVQEQQLENIPIEAQMELNQRDKFEDHIRLLVNDKIRFFKNLEL